MDWAREGPSWPLAELSRFVPSAPHVWHLQEAGEAGPRLLLLHGAGASTHSWRRLIPDLAQDFRVTALDLPGQGFTRCGSRLRCGLDEMATDIAALLAAEDRRPDIIVGHSAGAAIALRLAEILDPPPAGIVAINAALSRFPGVAGVLFPMMAKMLAVNPLVAGLFARIGASRTQAAALLRSTGGPVAAEDIELYRRLIGDSGHVDATLSMMARWNVDGLAARLPGVATPVLFITGGKDGAVAPRISAEAAARMPAAREVRLPALGHLAHEQAPAEVAALIRDFAGERCGGAEKAAEPGAPF